MVDKAHDKALQPSNDFLRAFLNEHTIASFFGENFEKLHAQDVNIKQFLVDQDRESNFRAFLFFYFERIQSLEAFLAEISLASDVIKAILSLFTEKNREGFATFFSSTFKEIIEKRPRLNEKFDKDYLFGMYHPIFLDFGDNDPQSSDTWHFPLVRYPKAQEEILALINQIKVAPLGLDDALFESVQIALWKENFPLVMDLVDAFGGFLHVPDMILMCPESVKLVERKFIAYLEARNRIIDIINLLSRYIDINTEWLNEYTIEANDIFYLFGYYKGLLKELENHSHSIEALVHDGEGPKVEFKSSFQWDNMEKRKNPELEFEVMKTIAALSNTEGGILLIGVDDNKNILGLENDYKILGKKQDKDEFQLRLVDSINLYFGRKYASLWNVFISKVNDKEICQVMVEKSSKPIIIKNKKNEELFFIRKGSASIKLSLSDFYSYSQNHFKGTRT